MSENSNTSRLRENADGSAVFVLEGPITVNGEQIERVTIPALSGRHMRKCPFLASSAEPSIGMLVDFAALVVIPAGAVDVMTPSDAIAVASRVVDAMGKSRASGGP